MLFNCTSCGKTVSSKNDACVYCKTDLKNLIFELSEQKNLRGNKQKEALDGLKTRYTGTVFSFLLRTK